MLVIHVLLCAWLLAMFGFGAQETESGGVQKKPRVDGVAEDSSIGKYMGEQQLYFRSTKL